MTCCRPAGAGASVRPSTRRLAVLAGVLLLPWLPGCEGAADDPEGGPASAEAAQQALGPVDGHELPPADLERVGVGDTAPDFALRSLRRGVVTLSDFRGSKDVLLVFYRGHW